MAGERVSSASRKSFAAASMRVTRSGNVSFWLIGLLLLAGNVDLFRSAAPKDLNSQGSRLGEQSQGFPLDGEPRLPKWKQERSGATLG
jgi:hypothetical protein